MSATEHVHHKSSEHKRIIQSKVEIFTSSKRHYLPNQKADTVVASTIESAAPSELSGRELDIFIPATGGFTVRAKSRDVSEKAILFGCIKCILRSSLTFPVPVQQYP